MFRHAVVDREDGSAGIGKDLFYSVVDEAFEKDVGSDHFFYGIRGGEQRVTSREQWGSKKLPVQEPRPLCE